jgi:Zn-dependent M16 (insulinase) family peptidase
MKNHRFAATAAIALASVAATDSAAQSLEGLREGQTLHGFRAEAVYLGGGGAPLGARLVHGRTGFTLDLLQLETAPQAFIWVNTFLVSDMGEPHTQEHLLLGKGNVGRAVANLESYSLVSSSAFVTQWRTQYHFNAPAGSDVFFRVLDAQLHALLNPDYTDEEIRREVRNIGVAEDPDGTLRLEEKGTVYQEMVSSFERSGSRLFRVAGHALYGEDHPLAMSAGGWPAAIREMTPEHIRDFHRATHHLGNMGMVAVLPRSEVLAAVLTRMDGILSALDRYVPEARGPFPTEADLPAPRSLPEGEVRFAEYPHRNPDQPSPLMFAWRPERTLALGDEVLLGLFLSSFAGDPTTNLYRVFVDTETREVELGAQSVSGWASRDQGHPVYVHLSDVVPSRATPERLAEARARILEELRTIAGWPDGSPELQAFNERLRGRILELRREMTNFASSPPGFGQRHASNRWATHLHRLASLPGFRKSVTLEPQLDEIESLLAGDRNLWREALSRWALLDRTPYVIMSRPSPELVEREDRERRERLQAELERLTTRFGVADPQEAIRRYAAEYDAETERLEALAAANEGRFLDDPPLSLDEPLDFRVERVGGDVPVVWSRFEGLPAATAGLALRMDAVPDEELLYLALLPALLTEVGVIRDGVPIPHGEMRNRLRREILSLTAYFSTNPHTGRVELMLRGAGNDAVEAERALGWMGAVLYGPDWRPENLPRIRDVVDQGLSGLRNTPNRAEETWVDDPANAYRYQSNWLYLAAASFQTRIHAAQRLRWQLREAPAAEAAALDAALASLGERGAGLERAALRELLRGAVEPAADLPAEATALLREAVRDLELTLADVPDASLQADFAYLVGQIRHDLRTPPTEALATLHRVRERLLTAPSARSFLVASPENGERLQPALAGLVAGLRAEPAPQVERPATPVVLERLRGRDSAAGEVVFVGLVNPNTQGGVFLNTARMASYQDRERAALLDFLAAQLYSGGGAHSMFMKTWAAGLAYSNGLRNSPATGLLTYYAERVPELPQTMRFVIDELRASPRDPALTEYALAMAFRGIRSAHGYEARGEAMANDLADGRGPDLVRGFLGAVLALRGQPGLADELYGRMERVYGQVLPGYGPASATVVDGVFFVIGPESQLRLYEEYLRTAEGAGTRLHRLYPRDFWIVE